MYLNQQSQQLGFAENAAMDQYGATALTLESWTNAFNTWKLNNAAGLFLLYQQQQQQQMIANQYQYQLSQQQHPASFLGFQPQYQVTQPMEVAIPHQNFIYNEPPPRCNAIPSPPAEPIAPPLNDESDDIESFENYRKSVYYKRQLEAERRKIRLEIAFIDLETTINSQRPCYNLFEDPKKFEFALVNKEPAKQSHPPYLSDHEYAEMRKHFASNGYVETFDVGCADFDQFPPLGTIPVQQQTMLSQVYTSPLQPSNVNHTSDNIQESDNSKFKDKKNGKKKNYEVNKNISEFLEKILTNFDISSTACFA
jgi:hypothetical protein